MARQRAAGPHAAWISEASMTQKSRFQVSVFGGPLVTKRGPNVFKTFGPVFGVTILNYEM